MIKYAVRHMDNRTAYDDFNEDTFEGPTNVELFRELFDNFDDALEYYQSQKTMYKFAGSKGRYVAYPTEVNA